MKRLKYYGLIAMIAITNFGVWGQSKNNSKIFEININGSDAAESNNCVPLGSKIKFKFSNVNNLKLNGHTTTNAVTIDFSAPAAFSSEAPSIESVADVGAVKMLIGKKVSESLSYHSLLESFNSRQTMFRQEIKVIKGKKKKASLGEQIKSLQKQIDNLQDALNSVNEEIVVLNKKIELLKNTEIEKENFRLNMKCFTQNFQNLSMYQAVESYIDTLLTPMIIVNTDVLKENASNYIESVYGTTNTLECHKTIYATLVTLNDCYIKLKENYEALSKILENDSAILSGSLTSKEKGIDIKIDNAKMELKYKKYFNEEYLYATKIIAQLNDPKIRTGIINKADAGIRLFNEVNKSKFEVYTDADQITSDQMDIIPLLKDNTGKVVKEFKKINIKSFGGIKVNFSSGYLLTFVGEDNYSYYTQGDSIRGITKQGKSQLTHAIGALCHVYRRSCKDLNFAGSAGLSITNEGTVGFYLGLSTLFTEKNRLALTAGASFIRIKKLNTGNLKSMDKETKYDFLSSANTNINYDNLYKAGFFIGITYNITKN